jgi:ketosteroid isomerase-like protein
MGQNAIYGSPRNASPTGVRAMTTENVAKAFVALLKEGRNDEAASTYNADDIVSHENMPGPMAVCRGKDAVRQKSEWWAANHEVHAFSAGGPYLNGEQFAVSFAYDITVKESGKRLQMSEVGLYTVRNGQIAESRFFY